MDVDGRKVKVGDEAYRNISGPLIYAAAVKLEGYWKMSMFSWKENWGKDSWGGKMFYFNFFGEAYLFYVNH